jgi:hypothetical protein
MPEPPSPPNENPPPVVDFEAPDEVFDPKDVDAVFPCLSTPPSEKPPELVVLALVPPPRPPFKPLLPLPNPDDLVDMNPPLLDVPSPPPIPPKDDFAPPRPRPPPPPLPKLVAEPLLVPAPTKLDFVNPDPGLLLLLPFFIIPPPPNCIVVVIDDGR